MDHLKDPIGEDYCRSIEAYLCRKNDGHLIRIVGPAFDRVCDWAARGVPLKVAYRGIDRYFERYYAKGPRRRPVRIEFCEADVLDVFDEWRRAVGMLSVRGRSSDGPSDPAGVADLPEADESEAAGRPRRSLAAHLERAIARLRSLESGEGDLEVTDLIAALEHLRGDGKPLRGAARQAALDQLRELDALLLDRARSRLADETLGEIRREAEAELAPFRDRMPPETYDRAVSACTDRIIRERERLPTIAIANW